MEKPAKVSSHFEGAHIIITFSGTWNLKSEVPSTKEILRTLHEGKHIKNMILIAKDLEHWDSILLATLVKIQSLAKEKKYHIDLSQLPEGLQKLMHMATAVSNADDVNPHTKHKNILEKFGEKVYEIPKTIGNVLAFIGDISLAFGRLLRGKADVRSRDIFAAMQECGAEALGIVSITSLLFGLILAFVGAVQLTQFGANRYVAGLVGIGMLRVMGAVMVGVVMSGRMGAAYAALIGTMQVNEEVDSLQTFGISPVDFLILPRIIALSLMTPLLTLYADLMGIFGGFLVGVLMLDLSPLEYINATIQMVAFKHTIIGLVYGTTFGIIIAIAGCYQGIRCGRSAEAVGQSTTAAVVNSIVWIIIATAIITVICNILKV